MMMKNTAIEMTVGSSEPEKVDMHKHLEIVLMIIMLYT